MLKIMFVIKLCLPIVCHSCNFCRRYQDIVCFRHPFSIVYAVLRTAPYNFLTLYSNASTRAKTLKQCDEMLTLYAGLLRLPWYLTFWILLPDSKHLTITSVLYTRC